jgi:hypothetical protein
MAFFINTIIRSKSEARAGASFAGTRTRNTSPERVRACDSSPYWNEVSHFYDILIINAVTESIHAHYGTSIPTAAPGFLLSYKVFLKPPLPD